MVVPSYEHTAGGWSLNDQSLRNAKSDPSFPYHAVLASLLAKAAEKAFWLSASVLYHSQELLLTGLWAVYELSCAVAKRDPNPEPQCEATLGKMKSPGLGCSLYHTWKRPALQDGYHQNQRVVEVTQPTILPD